MYSYNDYLVLKYYYCSLNTYLIGHTYLLWSGTQTPPKSYIAGTTNLTNQCDYIEVVI